MIDDLARRGAASAGRLLRKLTHQDNYLSKLCTVGACLPIPIAEQTGYADGVMSLFCPARQKCGMAKNIILEEVQSSG